MTCPCACNAFIWSILSAFHLGSLIVTWALRSWNWYLGHRNQLELTLAKGVGNVSLLSEKGCLVKISGDEVEEAFVFFFFNRFLSFFLSVLFFFFCCGSFLKFLFINLFKCCYCFMFCFSGHKACGILASWPGIEPTPPALEGEVLTTGLPGKSWGFLLVELPCVQMLSNPIGPLQEGLR